MIDQCNFKYNDDYFITCRIQIQQGGTCTSLVKCDGEDNCILYQIYKNTLPINLSYHPKTTEI